jgi:hypothetical protein
MSEKDPKKARATNCHFRRPRRKQDTSVGELVRRAIEAQVQANLPADAAQGKGDGSSSISACRTGDES